MGRRMGKSIVNLEYAILQEQAKQMSDSIDKMIIDEIWASDKYRIRKSWRDRRGRQMHRIAANDEVREWLETDNFAALDSALLPLIAESRQRWAECV